MVRLRSVLGVNEEQGWVCYVVMYIKMVFNIQLITQSHAQFSSGGPFSQVVLFSQVGHWLCQPLEVMVLQAALMAILPP